MRGSKEVLLETEKVGAVRESRICIIAINNRWFYSNLIACAQNTSESIADKVDEAS